MPKRRLAFFGRNDMRLGPVEEQDSKPLFDALESATQGRLRHVQDGSCAPKVALFVKHANDQKFFLRAHVDIAPASDALSA
jgi:hypothetical protein